MDVGATTVGLILKAVEERLPNLGKLVADLVGAAWAVATFFVIPVIALEPDHFGHYAAR